ncbi:MAG: hypothetical protein MI863_19040 [Desulfobacterales bacterium]|nr:hypothetical protein [Desulfobacterales bacterium]
MAEYLLVKESQIALFKNTPFYYQNGAGEYVIYKKKGERLDENRLSKIKYPDLYIFDADKDAAITELMTSLNNDLQAKIKGGDLKDVRQTLAVIMTEALTPSQPESMNTLPETIDILMGHCSKKDGTLKYLSQIASHSSLLIEHTVNITALTLHFCFFHGFSESDTRQLAMAAMLHDAGCAKLDNRLIESDKRLTDEQFKVYSTHPQLGHDLIILNSDFDIAVPTVALEHHERIDGSGYPNGRRRITSYAQLIGLIDCYESLAYRWKKYRKTKKPFHALHLIKEEVMAGKFSKEIFKQFTSCLKK